MNKQGKVWGWTVEVRPALHYLYIKKGHHCSEHLHAHRFNWFFVSFGTLKVRVWKNDYDLVDETTLEEGDYCVVKPGEYHQFLALEDTYAMEGYYVECKDSDIERRSVGGEDVPRAYSVSSQATRPAALRSSGEGHPQDGPQGTVGP